MTYTATATMKHDGYTDSQSAQAETMQDATDLLLATVEARGFRLDEREAVKNEDGETIGHVYQTSRRAPV